MTKRIDALDILKAIAIFLVVLGHVIQHCLSSNYVDEPVYRLIYSFHMPLFMILAGFFSRGSLQLRFKELVLKKSKELLLPCITWGGVIYLLIIISHYLSTQNFDFSFRDFGQLLIDDYWFLKSLFLCYVILWSCLKCRYSIFIIIISLFVVQLLNFFLLPVMYPCFVVGYYLKVVIDKPSLMRFKYLFLMIYMVSLLYSMFINVEVYNGDYESMLLKNGCFKGYLDVATSRLYKIVMGISGSLFIVLLVKSRLWTISSDSSFVIRNICMVGRNSLGIYLIHTLLVSYILGKYISFDNINPILFNLCVAPIVSFVVVWICMIGIKLLKQKTLTSVLFLGH